MGTKAPKENPKNGVLIPPSVLLAMYNAATLKAHKPQEPAMAVRLSRAKTPTLKITSATPTNRST
eukprot:CAMPEP_0204281718 /NCGR_PEP_ID=MMETSP0468-20130131/41609_1 /ASSEMBLY_ACC=CAM_ASM_000383 /TAXON_ID=2969 /ORGANISM="Oxyrrhis marina" /LENGTH=64 /DNA_ID=CAMNT_0051259115 /DNA_START=468 /DNA_END=662 /DNA_ORIENTATION=+